MNKTYGIEVFKQIKSCGQWGSFFTYSQYQVLKKSDDPGVVITMAQKNGYKDLDESMSPSELVESLLRQGPEKAEMKEIWKQAMFMTWFDPILTIIWVLLEKIEWRSNERKYLRERNQAEKTKQ